MIRGVLDGHGTEILSHVFYFRFFNNNDLLGFS